MGAAGAGGWCTQQRPSLLPAEVQRRKEEERDCSPMFQMSSVSLGKDVKIEGRPNSCSSPCAGSGMGMEVHGQSRP